MNSATLKPRDFEHQPITQCFQHPDPEHRSPEELDRIKKMLTDIRKTGNPAIEYRVDVKKEAIAGLHNGIWYRICMRTIRGQWFLMKYECLVNGQRVPFTPDTSL